MSKTSLQRFLIIFIILIILVSTVPSSSASQYGSLHGKVLDRYGNPIAGVSVTVQDGECRAVSTVVSNSDGSFAFDEIPIEGGSGTFRVYATLDKNDIHKTAVTTFVMVYPLQVTTQDVTFYDYPQTGVGMLYGVVSSNKDMIVETGAVIYLNNGMYWVYEGNKYDQWYFNLPAGDYLLWAEKNYNLTTYKSQNYSVHVSSDNQDYLLIFMPMKEQTRYHEQPVVQRNIVHGEVTQKNGMPLTGATAELYKCVGSGLELVDSTKTNSTGSYIFYNVNVRTVSEKYTVRITWDLNGLTMEQYSAPFDVYYVNTIGKQHDFNIPVSMSVSSTGNLNVRSTPPAAHIWIDGADTGKLTPCNITDITAGQHSVTLVLEGYYNDTSDVTVESDKTCNLNRTLESNTGSIYITATPDDAKIYLNGMYAGTGSVNLAKKPVGKYTYKVVRDGYQNESGSFDLIPGKQVNRSFEMVAVPALSITYLGYLLNNMVSSILGIF